MGGRDLSAEDYWHLLLMAFLGRIEGRTGRLLSPWRRMDGTDVGTITLCSCDLYNNYRME